jgi:hypothetical protein
MLQAYLQSKWLSEVQRRSWKLDIFFTYPNVQWYILLYSGHTFIYGHTKQEALHPVRSAKLSCLGPRQYYGGGPHGNPRCRRFYFCLIFALSTFELVRGEYLNFGTVVCNFGDGGL